MLGCVLTLGCYKEIQFDKPKLYVIIINQSINQSNRKVTKIEQLVDMLARI